jgi:hypothetical protein
MWPEQPAEEDDKPQGYKPGLIMVLITLLLILAMLATLVWPLLQIRHRQQPTPTPGILQEALANEVK